jgi:hypothetical protein
MSTAYPNISNSAERGERQNAQFKVQSRKTSFGVKNSESPIKVLTD